MGNFFGGLLMTLLGILFVVKTEWILDFVGYSVWAESKIGMFGGTRLLIKVIGLIAIVVGFFFMAGLEEEILGWIAGFLIPNYKGI